MRNQLVYDLPTRLFHWLFAGLFSTAYLIANTADESPIFPWHMLAGLTLGVVVVLRVIWGFIGTRHARFTSLCLSPQALFSYIKGIFTGEKQLWAGHNPASSWAAIIMIGLALGLGVTGYLMTSSGNAGAYEDIHELLANTFLAVVLLHIAGVVLHVVRHRDGFSLSMVDGHKQQVPTDEVIASSRPAVGVVFIAIVAAFAVTLVRNYDAATQSLNLFGTTLQLGENEANEQGKANKASEHSSKVEKDDD
jgi:cytochrome b